MRKRTERGTRFDSRPKHARMFSRGKPSETAHRNLDHSGRADASEHGLHFVQAIFRPLADELCRDMQIFDGRPRDARRGTEFFNQVAKIAANFVRNIDRGEQTHVEEPISVLRYTSS